MILFIVFSVLALNQYYQYNKSDKVYEDAKYRYYNEKDFIDNQTEIDNSTQAATEVEVTSSEIEATETTEPTDVIETTTEDNGATKEETKVTIAGNVIGWLTVDGTKIDYPVVQTTDNDFYLDHNYLGNKDVKGAIYMDFRNDVMGKDRNYIIYGHKMIDGTMFSDLTLYVQGASYKDYFENHNIIKYDDSNEIIEWKIFSAYVVNLNKEDYYLFTKYRTDDSFQAFLDEADKRSLVKSDITVSMDDEILTLVTCSFWYDNARVIVHAVRIK